MGSEKSNEGGFETTAAVGRRQSAFGRFAGGLTESIQGFGSRLGFALVATIALIPIAASADSISVLARSMTSDGVSGKLEHRV